MNSPAAPLLKRTWRELRRRKVVQVGVSYALIAWVVLQVAGVVFPPLHVPDWVMTWLVLAAILGFPIALLMAWWFERTPAGLVQDPRAVAGKGIRWLFGISVAVITVAALAWWLTRVYGVNRDDTPLDALSNSSAVITDNSIAVMPFADMSAEKDQQHLSDGLAEQLLDRLARVNGLKVASRTSAFALRDSKKGVKELGQILGAAYLVEGSVRKADGKLRITAQLIDTRTDKHMWSETYERENKDIFSIQDQITASIATELSKHVGGIDKNAAASPSATTTTQDATAMSLYLQGRAAWRQRTPGKLKEAISFFEQAIARDKNFAQAYAGLSDTYLMQSNYGSLPLAEALKKAEDAAVQAITLAPESGESWASLGLLRMTAGQFRSAETSLKEAMDRDPRYEMAPLWLARTYASMGQLRNQQAVLAKAVALNPLDPIIATNAAEAAINMGNDPEAEKILQRILAISPKNDMALRMMTSLSYSRGDLKRALDFANQAYQAEPEGAMNVRNISTVLLELGRYDELTAIVKNFDSNSPLNDEMSQLIKTKKNDYTLLTKYQTLVDQSLKTQSFDPNTLYYIVPLASILIKNKKYDQAVELLQLPLADEEKIGNQQLQLDMISIYIAALRQSGRQADANLWKERLNVLAKEWFDQGWGGSNRFYYEAVVAATNGDRELTIASLIKAKKAGWLDVASLDFDPRFIDILNDKRIQDLRIEFDADVQRMRDESAGIKIKIGSSV
jgi:TolB-like protein/Tfp pilus assembly protein PilF